MTEQPSLFSTRLAPERPALAEPEAPPAHLTLPPAVAVLRDWLLQHRPKLKGLRDDSTALAVFWLGERAEAPLELLSAAYRDAWDDWRERTMPGDLLRALAAVRGPRATAGVLAPNHIEFGVNAHENALRLAMSEGISPDNVRTWLARERYGCAVDEVRMRGSAATVHRLASLNRHQAYQTITYSPKEKGEGWCPAGWRAWSSIAVGRAARDWEGAELVGARGRRREAAP